MVSAAVAAAEAGTSGEIVTILAGRSDDYRATALGWASFFALAALIAAALIADRLTVALTDITGGWTGELAPGVLFGAAALLAATVWGALFLLGQWWPLRLAATPRWIKARRVRAHADHLFRVGAEARTEARTGILLYVSLAEHRAEIIADCAIADKVDPAVWGEAMARLLAQVRDGRIAAGIADAATEMGAVLAEHFPASAANPNELPDRLILL